MSTVVTRASKGAILSYSEVDANFNNLNKDKLENATLVSATAKSTPVDADTLPLNDSAASNALKKLSWANLKATIKTYYDNVTTTLTNKTITSPTLDADLNFIGTGNRITGDFSNTTISSRILFQSNTTNDVTSVGVIPNGLGPYSQFSAIGGNDSANASHLTISTGNSGTANIIADKSGSGSYLPIALYAGGAERLRIDTSGNVGIGRSPVYDSDVYRASGIVRHYATTESVTPTDYSVVGTMAGGYSTAIIQYVGGLSYLQATGTGLILSTTGNYPLTFVTNSSSKAVLDTNGGFELITPALLGYGVGAGGTVTQSTSKTTTVALNKPCGQIVINSASLAAGAVVGFTLTNSLIASTDVLMLNVAGTSAHLQKYQFWCDRCDTGSAFINIKNITGGALAESSTINFVIINGAAT